MLLHSFSRGQSLCDSYQWLRGGHGMQNEQQGDAAREHHHIQSRVQALLQEGSSTGKFKVYLLILD